MSCGIPCTPCLVEIINSGIVGIVVTKFEFYDSSSKYLLDNSDINVRLFSHLCEHKGIKITGRHAPVEGVCPDCGIDLEIS